MIITIEGKPKTGKSTLAESILEGKKYVQIRQHEVESSFGFRNINEETEFILIDNVTEYKMVFDKFNKDTITINIPYKYPFVINTPNVIIIKQQ